LFVFITKSDTVQDSTKIEEYAKSLFKVTRYHKFLLIKKQYEFVSTEKWQHPLKFNKFLQEKVIKNRLLSVEPRLEKFHQEMVRLTAKEGSAGATLVNDLISLVVNGYDTLQLESAIQLAERYETHYDTVEEAVDGLIQYQMMFTGGTGFVTGNVTTNTRNSLFRTRRTSYHACNSAFWSLCDLVSR
jgi:hypothetical protein